MKNFSEQENAVKIGEIIPFSGYKWRVLDVQKNQALLISEFVLEERPYHREYRAVTWENCTLRHYLNKDFYNKLSEKSRIAQRKISNKDNQWFGTSGGNDTTDHIFLLSLEEVVQYFGDSGQLKNNRNDWLIYDQFSDNRIAKNSLGTEMWWWLRSPGSYSNRAVDVDDDGGICVGSSTEVWAAVGVRPALWLNLQPNTKQLSKKIGNHKIRKGVAK